MSIMAGAIKDRDRVLIVEAGRLHPSVSVSSSANGTYINGSGIIVSAPANTPRFDYSTSGVYLGLLIEESRTNLVKYSQDFTNAAWSKGNGASAVSNGSTFCGVPYCELSKTTTASSSGISQVAFSAVSGTILTFTVALRGKVSTQAGIGLIGATSSWGASTDSTCTIVSGAGTITRVSSFNGALFNITGLSTTADTIVTVTRTYQQSENASAYIYPDTFSSTTIGNSILATRAQVESGSFATSYIPTTTATVNRTADLVTINTPSQVNYNANAGTLVVLANTLYGNPNSAGVFCAGLTARHLYVNTSSVLIYNGTNSAGQSITVGTPFKVVTSYGTNLAITVNGATVSTGGTTTTMSATALYIGRIATGGNLFNGWIKYLAYYPKQRAASELKALSI